MFGTSLNVDVPLAWEVLFSISGFFCSTHFLIAFGVFALIYWQVVGRLVSSGPFNRLVWRVLFKVPFVRKVAHPVCEERLASALALTLQAGTRPVESLLLVADAMSNPLFKKACLDMARGIKDGGDLTSVFTESGIFSPTFLALIEVGEETGKLPEQLKCYSKMVSLTIDEDIKAILSLLQPLVFVGLGLSVLLLAVSLIKPLSAVVAAL